MNGYLALIKEQREENDKLHQQITQITNNWNELEEWLKERNDIGYSNIHTLNKMKEIKEKNNE